MDTDEQDSAEYYLNTFVESKTNAYTRRIAYIEKNVESFLGINPPQQNSTDKKPLNVMWHYNKGKIAPERLDKFKEIIMSVLA